ncbi:hypothetical protein J6590_091528, partial [Homalodisca vitripennis]
VQIAKSILKKSNNESEVFVSLLEYRSTPVKGTVMHKYVLHQWLTLYNKVRSDNFAKTGLCCLNYIIKKNILEVVHKFELRSPQYPFPPYPKFANRNRQKSSYTGAN